MQIPSLCGHRGRCHGAVAENKQNSPHIFSEPSTRCPSALLTRRAWRGCAHHGVGCPQWGGMSLAWWGAPSTLLPTCGPQGNPSSPSCKDTSSCHKSRSKTWHQPTGQAGRKLPPDEAQGKNMSWRGTSREKKKKAPRLGNNMGWDQETAGGCAGGCSEPRAPGHPHGEVWGQHRAGAQLRARAARPRLALPSCRPQEEEIFGGEETTARRGAQRRARGAGGARFASPLKSLGKGFPSCLLGTCLLCLIPI